MYRNNLVRTTLSVFVACTLLYTASASAQQTLEVLPEPDSVQIGSSVLGDSLLVGWSNAAAGVTTYELTLIATTENRVAAIQEVSAVDGSGAFAFESIDLMTAYTLRVVAKGDASVYAPSPPYRVSVYQPQLETPAGFLAFPSGDGVGASGASVQGVRYIFKLYLGGDTSSTALDTRSILNNSISVGVVFPGLEPLTQYTVEIIARADNYRDSNPRVVTVTTEKANINAPTANELRITSSTDNITVTFEDTQSGVDGYALSIRERFDDMGIAQSTEDSSIGESPVTFTNLVPNRAYTLMALPTFESERYEYSGGIVSLDFATRNLLLPNVEAAFEARRENTVTVTDIRVAWDPVEGAQDYTVSITIAGTPFLRSITVSAPETTTVFENQLNNALFRATVMAVIDPTTSRVGSRAVRPPKLSSEFFTVTPSHNSLSLFWDSSYDASLEDGVYFYDATYIGNLGSSASSILLINIEDDEGNRITGPAQVSTEADTYSIGGLSDETNYVLKIVQRVRRISNDPRDSEALEIPFRTKQELPEPTGTQIRSAVDGTTLTVDWDNVAPGVTNYDLSLITREGTTIGAPKEVNALMAGSTIFTSLNAETNYILGVVAKGDTNLYGPSPQYFVAVSPKLPSDLFNLNEGSNSLRLNWNSEEITNFDDETNTATNYLFFSIVDMDGNLVGNESMASTRTQTHDFSGLEQTTEYKLKIVVGVLVKDFIGTQATLLKSEALEIPFRTLEELPEPTKIQISWARGETTLTVSWDDVPTNVTSYEISLATAEGAVIGIPKEVSALMAGSTTFTSLDAETTYTLSVVAKGDPSVYSPSPPYHISVQPQLDTPVIADTTVVRNIITIFWSSAQMENVEKYRLNLYLGNDTSGQASRSEEIGNDSNSLTLVFAGLEALEQYTVELIAQAVGYRDSNPVTRTLMTEIGLLDPPTANELRITESADNIRVNFQNTQVGVDGYSLSIQKRFDDLGIAQSTENFTISDSPVTFTDLLPSRAYTLMAEPTFNSERYEYTGGIVSLDFMTLDTPLLLPLRLRVFLEGPLQ